MMENLTQFFPIIGAALGGVLIFFLGEQLSENIFRPKTSKRVKDLMGGEETKRIKIKPTDFGSNEFKIRLAFHKFGIDVYKYEKLALNIARLALAIVFVSLLHFFFNFPIPSSMVGLFGGFLIINSMVENAWKGMCNEIDKEIPIFLSGFTSTIQVNPNVLQAVEEESSVLAVDSALQRWLKDRFVRLGQDRGVAALEELIEEAFRISNSLGIMIFLIGRLWRTGGLEWKRSFALAAANLEGVMEAKMLGIAAGSSAKGAVMVVIGITMAVILIMARNPMLSQTTSSPVVQVVYVITILMMIFGYSLMGNMIDSKL
jgi:hypothetical protein